MQKQRLSCQVENKLLSRDPRCIVFFWHSLCLFPFSDEKKKNNLGYEKPGCNAVHCTVYKLLINKLLAGSVKMCLSGKACCCRRNMQPLALCHAMETALDCIGQHGWREDSYSRYIKLLNHSRFRHKALRTKIRRKYIHQAYFLHDFSGHDFFHKY